MDLPPGSAIALSEPRATHDETEAEKLRPPDKAANGDQTRYDQLIYENPRAIRRIDRTNLGSIDFGIVGPKRAKWLSEQALAWSGLPVVAIRPTVFLEGFFLISSARRETSSAIGK
jgi:hypothetical protein